jgi:hypothetical protein
LSPPKGDAVDDAKLPKPEALNFSSDVCGSESVELAVFGACGFAAIAANGDSAEVFAKPLPGETYTTLNTWVTQNCCVHKP